VLDFTTGLIPQVALPAAGTYLLTATVRVVGVAAGLTVVDWAAVQLYDAGAAAAIAGSTVRVGVAEEDATATANISVIFQTASAVTINVRVSASQDSKISAVAGATTVNYVRLA
jgi:hypothetical protein